MARPEVPSMGTPQLQHRTLYCFVSSILIYYPQDGGVEGFVRSPASGSGLLEGNWQVDFHSVLF